MVIKEISSVKNWKEAFWEITLCSVNSSHRVTAFPSRCRSLYCSCEISKRYLVAHIGLWWKRKYLQLKTEKKLSEKLPCVLLIIHLTELQLSPQEAFAKNVFVRYSKSYLEAHRGLWWKRKYLPLKSGKKLSEKLLCVLLIHLRELQLPLKKLFTKTFHVEFAKLYLEALTGLWWKRKYSKVKTE